MTLQLTHSNTHKETRMESHLRNTEWSEVGMVYSGGYENVSSSTFHWRPRVTIEESMNSPAHLPLHGYQPWLYSIIAAIFVGFAGIVPLIFIPLDYETKRGKNLSSFNLLHLLLSFGVGGLLADVFLHLLPEAWTTAIKDGSSPHEAFIGVGLCVLAGIFVFIVVEMLAYADKNAAADDWMNHSTNGTATSVSMKEKKSLKKRDTPPYKKKVIGYLNLIANGIDNFAHGLAVAGSFLVSYKTGVLTTTAILIHEIPHEIGDFAILLKSGFNRWEAAKAQLYTASIGLLGAIITLLLGTSEIMGGLQVYILGFTAGGFLNIALVSVLPELLQEERPIHSAAQLLFLLFGTLTMASVALLC